MQRFCYSSKKALTDEDFQKYLEVREGMRMYTRAKLEDIKPKLIEAEMKLQAVRLKYIKRLLVLLFIALIAFLSGCVGLALLSNLIAGDSDYYIIISALTGFPWGILTAAVSSLVYFKWVKG